MVPDALRVLESLVVILDRHDIPYVVGGSIASGAWGEPRTTHDVDMLARLREDQVKPFLHDVSPKFYADEISVREAMATHRSFNVVHLELFQKIDIFVAGDALLDREQMERRVRRVLHPELQSMYVTSPEVLVLRKLDWFRRGDEVSERQFRDVVAILKVQASRVDVDYLRRTADEVGLGDLLLRAIRNAESGLR